MSIITDAVDYAGAINPRRQSINGGTFINGIPAEDASRLQMAQALAVAKQQQPGQTSTSGQMVYGKGGSPLERSITQAKQLLTSTLDHDSLGDDQKTQLDAASKDPNIGFSEYQSLVGSLRGSQQSQARLQAADDKTKAAAQSKSDTQAQRVSMSQGRAQITNLRRQQQQTETQARQLEKDNFGLDEAADEQSYAKGSAADAATFRKYKGLKSKSAALQQQLDAAVSGLGTQPAPQQAAAAAQPGVQNYGGFITNQPVSTTPAGPHGAVQPGFRGPLPADYSQHYLAAANGDPQKAAQAAAQDGWAIPNAGGQQQQQQSQGQIGQVLQTPKGNVKIVGFDTDGHPLIEPVGQ